MQKKLNIKKIVCSFFVLFVCSVVFSQKTAKTSIDNGSKVSSEKSARELAKEREKARLERKAAADLQDAYEEAVETFQLNKPAEAIPLLEYFLGDDKHEAYNPDVYVYLSVAYYQIEEYQKAIDICEVGLKKENTDFKVLYFNEGNAAYALGQYMKASVLYKKSMEVDSQYAPAALNLANAELRQDKLEEARDNYIKYLELKPDTVQRPEIEKMIGLLNDEIDYRSKMGPQLVENELERKIDDTPANKEIIDNDDIINNHLDDGYDSTREVMSDSETKAPDLPVEKQTVKKTSSGEIVNSDEKSAPALPVEKTSTKAKGEKLNAVDKTAPALPVEDNASNKPKGEKLRYFDNIAPDLPIDKTKKSNGEVINKNDSTAPDLPVDKKVPSTNSSSTSETVKMSGSETKAPDIPNDKKVKGKQNGEKIRVDAPKLPEETKKNEKMEKVRDGQEPPKLPDDSNNNENLLKMYGDSSDIIEDEIKELSDSSIDAK